MNGKSDVYHVVISVVLVIEAGFLLLQRPSLESGMVGVICMVAGYWFGSRKNGNGNYNGGSR